MDKKVSIKLNKKKTTKEPKINQYGNRFVVNWCRYALWLEKREQVKSRKDVVVSTTTNKDEQVYNEAYRKLMKERLKKDWLRKKALARLKMARKAQKTQKSTPRPKSDDEFVPCLINYKNPVASQSTPRSSLKPKKSKSQNSIKSSKLIKTSKSSSDKPGISSHGIMKKSPVRASTLKKSKMFRPPAPPKKKIRPVIVIPPFKTRPWNPILVRPKREKKLIVYPPLTLRKTPWKPLKFSYNKAKITPRVRLEKTFYEIPVNTLGKTWHNFKHFAPNLQILRGKTSQYSRKFNFRSNGKQSAFIAVIALVNTQMCAMKNWASEDLDEIVSYGDINFRKQLYKLRLKSVIKPNDIKLKIFTSRAKISTEIGVTILKGYFDYPNLKDLVGDLEQMLGVQYDCCILTYRDQSYAIWKEDKAYYIFNSEDSDEHGNTIERTHGGCCVVRTPTSLTKIAEYFARQQKFPKKPYELFSFVVREKVTIADEMERLKSGSGWLNFEEFCAEIENVPPKQNCGEIFNLPAIVKCKSNPLKPISKEISKKPKRKPKKCWQIAQKVPTDSQAVMELREFPPICKDDDEESSIESDCEN